MEKKIDYAEKIAEIYYHFFGCLTYQILDQSSFVDVVIETERERREWGLKMTDDAVIVSFKKRMKKLCHQGKAVDLLGLRRSSSYSSSSLH